MNKTILLLLFNLLLAIGSFAQKPSFINKWKYDTTGCIRFTLIDSLTKYLETEKPSKRWIKRNLGGIYETADENMYGHESFSFLVNNCSLCDSCDMQIIYIYIKKRRFEDIVITMIG